MTHTQNHTDIVTKGWVAKMPSFIKPYLYLMRLDRPIGAWLLLLPGVWAIMASGGGLYFDWPFIVLFTVGAIIMRGAGCVVNDLWDRDLDKKVERTKTRPIASNKVSIKQAIMFIGLLLLMGLVILLQFNGLTIILGCVSLIFIVIYPLMKRITWWPQAFLGLTFNFGALMGWAAVTGELPWQAWLLYASGFFWTLGYDTIYAVQDREDDALVGIKSTARLLTEKFGKNISAPLYGFYLIHFIMLWVSLFYRSDLNIIEIVISLLPALHLIWQVKTLSLDDPQNALNRFKSNRDYGILICGVILILS